MKTLLINLPIVNRIALALVIFPAFVACTKYNPPKCEKWEVEDAGYIKEGCLY
jgi:hypothetical protein